MPVYPIRCLLLLALLSLVACERDASTQASPPADSGAASAAAPATAPTDLPASWPTGDAVTLALQPSTGANTLTKALFERGDIVLEQRWPDGTRERWWHATDGSTRYIGRDGIERAEGTP